MDWSAYVRRHLRLQGLDAARESEIVEDVAHQLDDAYREALAAGLAEPEARARAERHITDWGALARDLSAVPRLKRPAVDRWSSRLDERAIARGRFGGIGGDIRHGIRLMLKTPGFSALAILMLALGTGANAAVFSVVDAVMLRSPFERPSEIAGVTATGADGRPTATPRDLFERLAGLSHVVASAATRTIGSPIVTNVEIPRRTQVECYTAPMIDVLGSRPLLGRWFSAAEDTPAGPPVGLVSYAFWQGTLNADPNVLGRRILLDDSAMTIIGVMRRGFDGAASLLERDIYVPAGQSTAGRPAFGCRPPGPTVSGYIRVRPGLSLDDAAASVNAALGGPVRIRLYSVSEEALGDRRGMFTALTGAVVAILFIACANVANLGLARLVGRRREIAVRLALGATRGRLLRQTVTEQFVIAAAGAAAGVLIAAVTFDAVLALLPRGLPHVAVVELNARVLAASIGITLAAALVVGLIPAIQASAVALRAGLSQDSRAQTPGGRRMRWALVGSELTLGTMLLVGALLMVRTFLTLLPSEPGFDPANKIAAIVRLDEGLPLADRRAFRKDVALQLAELPGIRAVALASHLPFVRSEARQTVSVDGASGEVISRFISPNYQDVMRIPVVRGRGLNDGDGPEAPAVALVNEAFVRRWIPDRDPLGAVVALQVFRSKTTDERRIVGIVSDNRYTGADTLARPEIFVPIDQGAYDASYFIISGTPAALAAAPATLRRVVSGLRPGQLVDRIQPLDAILAEAVSYPRLGAWLLGLFGGLAVLLAAIGLGGTLAWSVAERRREIGVRMALGASPGAIRTLVIRQTMLLTSLAVAIGLAAAWFASRLIEGWLYGVTRTDVVTYALCGAAMLVVALVAAYFPTRRATRVDPLTSLRTDG